jgi:hypothetical protein
MARRQEQRVQSDYEIPVETFWKDHLRLSRKVPDHTFAFHGALKEAKWRGIYTQGVLATRNWYMAKEHNDSVGLKEQSDMTQRAYPSAPHRPARYSVSFRWAELADRFMILTFGAEFSARHCIDFMIEDDEYKWLNDITIQTDRGIVIGSDHLEHLMEYEMSKKEKSWEPPEPYPSMWRTFRDGKQTKARQYGEVPPIEPEKPRQATPGGAAAAKPRPADAQRQPRKPGASRVAKAGYITVGQLSAQLGIEPTHARAALRGAKLEKPEGGWQWPQGEIDKIKKIIMAGVKKK